MATEGWSPERLRGHLAFLYATYKDDKTPVPLLLGAPGIGKSVVTKEAFVTLGNALTTLCVKEEICEKDEFVEEIVKRCRGDPVCEDLVERLRALHTNGMKPKLTEILMKMPKSIDVAKRIKQIAPHLVDGVVVEYDASLNGNVDLKHGLVYIKIVLSTHEPSDLAGLPYIDKKDETAALVPTKWAKIAKEANLAVINLDEFTNKMSTVMKSVSYSLTLEKRAGFYYFDQPVVATGNDRKSSSLVDAFPGPLFAARIVTYSVTTPTIEEWASYMHRNYGREWFVPLKFILKLLDETVGNVFMADEKTILKFSRVMPERGTYLSFPTPRAWEKLARILHTYMILLKTNPANKDSYLEEVKEIVASTVGDMGLAEVIATAMSNESFLELLESIEKMDLDKIEKELDGLLDVFDNMSSLKDDSKGSIEKIDDEATWVTIGLLDDTQGFEDSDTDIEKLMKRVAEVSMAVYLLEIIYSKLALSTCSAICGKGKKTKILKKIAKKLLEIKSKTSATLEDALTSSVVALLEEGVAQDLVKKCGVAHGEAKVWAKKVVSCKA